MLKLYCKLCVRACTCVGASQCVMTPARSSRGWQCWTGGTTTPRTLCLHEALCPGEQRRLLGMARCTRQPPCLGSEVLSFITGANYNTHHCTLYDLVGWSSLTERRNKHCHLFIHKALIGKLPPYISSMLHVRPSIIQTGSSDWLVLQPRFANTALGQQTAFSISAPDSWNLLQQEFKLNTLPSIGRFKNLLNNRELPVCRCFN